jgi:hypothetical protein
VIQNARIDSTVQQTVKWREAHSQEDVQEHSPFMALMRLLAALGLAQATAETPAVEQGT